MPVNKYYIEGIALKGEFTHDRNLMRSTQNIIGFNEEKIVLNLFPPFFALKSSQFGCYFISILYQTFHYLSEWKLIENLEINLFELYNLNDELTHDNSLMDIREDAIGINEEKNVLKSEPLSIIGLSSIIN